MGAVSGLNKKQIKGMKNMDEAYITTKTLGLFHLYIYRVITPLDLCNPLANPQKNPFSLSKSHFNWAVNSQITVRSEEKVFQNKVDNAFKFNLSMSVKLVSSQCWFHIETSQVIFIANPLTGCDMKATWDFYLTAFLCNTLANSVTLI